MLKIIGYADEISVRPGGRIKVMVSCPGTDRFRADVRRIVQGDVNPEGPGYRDETVEIDLGGPFPGRVQPIHTGSYVEIGPSGPAASLESFTIALMTAPSMTKASRQALVCHRDPETGAGFSLHLDDDGRVRLDVGNVNGDEAGVGSGRSMLPQHWYLIVASFDAASATMQIEQRPLRRYAGTPDRSAATLQVPTTAFTAAGAYVPILLGAESSSTAPVCSPFNGRIDSPRLYRAVIGADAVWEDLMGPVQDAPDRRLIASWDFSLEMTTQEVIDTSPNRLNGKLVNLPARAVTGFRWTGECMDWTQRPEHYSAIHFHDDDLYDAGWDADIEFAIPPGLKSGAYAVRLVDDTVADDDVGPTDEYFVIFCVRPAAGASRSRVAFLLPTASYMAYANHRLGLDVPGTEIGMGRAIELSAHHLYLQQHAEVGLSVYEVHNDGSGVFHSSRLRPILDMQPKVQGWLGGRGSGLWQFNADTHILGWLDTTGEDFDVLTDEDLHAEGLASLAGYRTIVTGTHPEYYSAAMLDALQAFVDDGGRLMYLGGNGFYWRISYSTSFPGAIELRRSESGIRPWEPGTGNYYHSFTGEYGGLWRRNGRPPNQLAGVGMTSQGFDVSSPYMRTDVSNDPRAAFIFEGVEGPVIGAFGLSGGGAAGLELDRADPAQGTPPHALVLASSERHTDVYLMTPEDMLDPTPDMSGTQSPLIRADMVFFETPGGGAVFSTGSIAWAGAMAWGNYDNEIARISSNVLRRFVDPAPFDPPMPQDVCE
jgi:N,N-dimethylformamidase